MKQLNVGVEINNERICLLMYADNVILLANNEEELQSLLDCLAQWCERSVLKINRDKSKMIHFRRPASPCSNYVFSCGDHHLGYAHQYAYLAQIFSEHLDFNIMAKAVSLSASRALGLLSAKAKVYGNFPLGTLLSYMTTVYSVIS